MGHRICFGEEWVANYQTSFGVDENHPRLVRMSELVQKSGTVGLTDEELVEWRREDRLLMDEVIPIWNAAHPERIIHGGRRGPTGLFFAKVKANLIDKNDAMVARLLEIRSRQEAGISSAEEMEESKRLYDELIDDHFLKHLRKGTLPHDLP